MIRIAGIVVVLSMLFASCSSMTVLRTKEMQKMGDDVKQSLSLQMKEEIAQLQKEVDSLRQENERLQSRLNADMKSLQERVSESVSQSNVRHEELLFRLDAIVKSTAGIGKKIVAVQATEERSSGATDSDTTSVSQSNVATVNPELEQLYETARADFQRGEYKLAYDGFKQIFEKSKVGPFAENALYWMGLCLVETNQIDKAMVLFQKVLEVFPNGTKTCVVLMKLSEHASTLGKREEQARYLEALAAKSQCRDSNEAYKALEILDTLRAPVK